MCLFLIVDYVVKRSGIVLGRQRALGSANGGIHVFILFFFNLIFSDVPSFKIK